MTPYWLLLIAMVVNGNVETSVGKERFATFDDCRAAAERVAELVATPKILVCDQVSDRREFSTVKGTWK